MVMTTINAISASAEGVGLSQVDAFKTAIGAVIDVVKTNVETKSSVDFSDSDTLENIQSKARDLAVTKGADQTAVYRALDTAIEKTKTINSNIKSVENIFSDEAKEVFASATAIITETKEDAKEIASAVVVERAGLDSGPKLKIKSVASDNIINSTEKVEGFKVIGTSSISGEITAKFGEITRTKSFDKGDSEFEINFDFDSNEKTTLANSDYPTKVGSPL